MTASPSRPLARSVLVAIALALTAAAFLPLALAGDLPDPLATRWSFDGGVTSTMSESALLTMALVMVAPSALVLLAVAVSRREARTGSRTMWTGAVAMLGAVLASAVVMTVAANQGHERWQDVPGPAVWQIAALVVVSLVVGGVAAWAASGLPHAPADVPAPRPLEVDDTAVVAWSRGLTVRWLVAVGAVTVVAGVALLALSADAWSGAIVIVAGLPAMLLSRIDVFADRRGLTVAYGPWGWPRTKIPVERIASATAIDVNPAEWGGWGYRGSVKLFRQGAVVLRKGPGIRVDLTDGRRFAVTIDDPETAAAVLNREVVRAGG